MPFAPTNHKTWLRACHTFVMNWSSAVVLTFLEPTRFLESRAGRKISSLQSKSFLLSYTDGCDEIRPEMLSLESRRSSLADSCVSSGLVFWNSTEILANWGDHPHTQKGRQEQWRAEVWWCQGRLLDCMPHYQILVLSSGVWWLL